MHADKEALLRRGSLGRKQPGEATQRTASHCMACSLRFYGEELVSGLSLPITLTQGPSWWLMHCSAKRDSSK